ncbi:MAG: hypothetical protein IPM66_24670 [Acidobacteriota bacterium]|nr:MAG: hypothetical protein IPM66_24670 [Acidobacteriota bacterium]
MMIQRRQAARKLHSIFVTPSGRLLTGTIEVGRTLYGFEFAPRSLSLRDGKPVLRGTVTVSSPAGRKRSADGIEAVFLSSQGSIQPPPPAPNGFRQAARRVERSLPPTDWTDETSSVAAIFMKLSTMNGGTLGVPLDLSAVQLNLRFYTRSQTERNLNWLYSNLVYATLGGSPDEKLAEEYVAGINLMLRD